ncbi:MAG TPA: cytochrome ubiquinol oxidase subunit I [Marmoricola sp.]|nr:cytochrome ubiquinol oxidase subunit I [Marmoricola sp.]
MDVTEIARWQFGITTVYHFLFVPITIGLSAIIASFQLMWLRTNSEQYLRLTKFFGKLFLINFAIGLVTGIVQEFQFGMNWSDYSRFVGDIFGAPLAVEALLAFFLESTFLGLWIFGWDRLPRLLHASCMWIVHLGTLASAYMILAANSWMQHPVGLRINPEQGRAELTDFWAVLFNKVQLVTFPHVVLSAYATAGAFVLGVAAYLYFRNQTPDADRPMYLKAVRIGAAWLMVAGLGVAISGDIQGKIMTEVQPMKMAAAEGLYETTSSAPFSVLSIGTLDGSQATNLIEVPGMLSFLATGTLGGEVRGINPLEEQYRAEFAGNRLTESDSYKPIIPVTYWSFRFMMGFGFFAAAGGALILFLTRKGRQPTSKWLGRLAISLPIVMVLANSWGWIFTEMGRQPWVVFGYMTTATGVSPGVSVFEAWTSLIVLTLLYGVLAVIEFGLLWRYLKAGADPFQEPPNPGRTPTDDDAPLAFAY